MSMSIRTIDDWLSPYSADKRRVLRCGLFTKEAKTIVELVSSVELFGRSLRALSATVPISRNLEIKYLTVLCEIGSLSGCRLLKSAAMTRKLRSPDIKMTSILCSVVKSIFIYLQQIFCNF